MAFRRQRRSTVSESESFFSWLDTLFTTHHLILLIDVSIRFPGSFFARFRFMYQRLVSFTQTVQALTINA